jgi:hypothetical protein
MHLAGDEKMLGNTPVEESLCRGHHCLEGPPLDGTHRARHVLVVAWRDGCLNDGYRAFLEDLASRHRDDLEVLGAALAVPPVADGRSLAHPPRPPPDVWPPRDCAPRFEILPVESGYASDLLSEPVTYLCDADGNLRAAWRGGMGPEQRERLQTWLDGRFWDGR